MSVANEDAKTEEIDKKNQHRPSIKQKKPASDNDSECDRPSQGTPLSKKQKERLSDIQKQDPNIYPMF